MDVLRRAGGTVVPFSAIGNTLVKETPNDGRMAPRRRVLKAGIAASNDRHLTIACAVRDLSATGARLRVEGSLSIPDTFELIIEVDGIEANCEVVWRKGNEVHRLAGVIDSIDGEIRDVRTALDDEELEKKERKRLAYRLGVLAYERVDAQRAYDAALDRARDL